MFYTPCGPVKPMSYRDDASGVVGHLTQIISNTFRSAEFAIKIPWSIYERLSHTL